VNEVMSSNAKILIVEDNADDAELLGRAFSKAGEEVALHFVRNGQEALDYLKGTNAFADRNVYPVPTLLLLDLRLPKIDGFEVIRWVRQEAGLRDLKIVVLSASGDRGDIARAHGLGVNAYHVKPTDANAWAGMLEGLRTYWVEQTR